MPGGAIWVQPSPLATRPRDASHPLHCILPEDMSSPLPSGQPPPHGAMLPHTDQLPCAPQEHQEPGQTPALLMSTPPPGRGRDQMGRGGGCGASLVWRRFLSQHTPAGALGGPHSEPKATTAQATRKRRLLSWVSGLHMYRSSCPATPRGPKVPQQGFLGHRQGQAALQGPGVQRTWSAAHKHSGLRRQVAGLSTAVPGPSTRRTCPERRDPSLRLPSVPT